MATDVVLAWDAATDALYGAANRLRQSVVDRMPVMVRTRLAEGEAAYDAAHAAALAVGRSGAAVPVASQQKWETVVQSWHRVRAEAQGVLALPAQPTLDVVNGLRVGSVVVPWAAVWGVGLVVAAWWFMAAKGQRGWE